MARTYTWENAVSLISRQVPRMVESDSAADICNIAMAQIWNKYDWRESLGVLPPFYVVPDSQDHGAPAVTIPADFLGIRSAYFIQLNATPPYREHVQPVKDLELTPVRGMPTCIGYQPAQAAFRLFPRVPINLGAPDWCIQGEYKKRPVKITSGTMSNTLLPFDDLYLMNMTEVLKWIGWQMSSDQRAQAQYALAHAAIDQMAMAESLELGDVVIAPIEPLANTSKNFAGSTWGRIFGW